MTTALATEHSPWLNRTETRVRVLAEEAFAGWSLYDMAAVMTIVIILLHMPVDWYINPPSMAIGVAGLIFRPLIRQPLYWFAMGLVVAAGHVWQWDQSDNHKYLLAYWCFALGLSMMSAEQLRTIALNGRLLIGLLLLIRDALEAHLARIS